MENKMKIREAVVEEIKLEKDLKTGSLSLRGHSLSEVPDDLFELSHLTKLDLSKNHIETLPDSISKLVNLKELYLNENKLTTLPLAFSLLRNLVFLDIGLNVIERLPFDLHNLTNLEYLRLGSNKFTELPPGIGKLTKLQTLIADHLALSVFPSEVTDLKQLRILNLSNNKIVDLPREFTKLISLRDFIISGNNLTRPPLEIMSRGPGAIINYLHAFDKDGDVFHIREAKLLIVGQGAVGKTFLMNSLIHDEAPKKGKTTSSSKKTATTEGIDINSWYVLTKDNSYFRINFWDFGGQEIYHATHQFFLTKRSLYLFVWDARKEDNILDFDYWLNTIKLLSDSSPVIIR
ncbi:MAG: leucine-rich repeat domain-containing protein [Deltaproteobacteria bacterium]|nr:leucine-rich repeat domain-containing protein [Deltaproteobacteria bacterium]